MTFRRAISALVGLFLATGMFVGLSLSSSLAATEPGSGDCPGIFWVGSNATREWLECSDSSPTELRVKPELLPELKKLWPPGSKAIGESFPDGTVCPPHDYSAGLNPVNYPQDFYFCAPDDHNSHEVEIPYISPDKLRTPEGLADGSLPADMGNCKGVNGLTLSFSNINKWLYCEPGSIELKVREDLLAELRKLLPAGSALAGEGSCPVFTDNFNRIPSQLYYCDENGDHQFVGDLLGHEGTLNLDSPDQAFCIKGNAEKGILGPFNIVDENGCSLKNYNITADTNQFGIGTPVDDVHLFLANLFFTATRWFVGLAVWIVDWALNFRLADTILAPARALTEAYQTNFVDKVSPPGFIATVAIFWCVIGIVVIKKENLRGYVQLGLTGLVMFLGTVISASPADLLLSENGFMGRTKNLALEIAAVTTGSGTSSSNCSFKPQAVMDRYEENTRQLTNAMTCSLVETFIYKSHQLINYGAIIDGTGTGKQCPEQYIKIINSYPQHRDNADDNLLNLLKECEGASVPGGYANYNAHIDAERSFGVFATMIAAGVTVIFIITAAATVLLAQIFIAFLAMFLPVAILIAQIPGTARSALWYWIGSLLRVLLGVIVAVMFLALFLVAVRTLFTAEVVGSDNELIIRYVLIVIVALAAFANRREIVEKARKLGSFAARAGQKSFAGVGGIGRYQKFGLDDLASPNHHAERQMLNSTLQPARRAAFAALGLGVGAASGLVGSGRSRGERFLTAFTAGSGIALGPGHGVGLGAGAVALLRGRRGGSGGGGGLDTRTLEHYERVEENLGDITVSTFATAFNTKDTAEGVEAVVGHTQRTEARWATRDPLQDAARQEATQHRQRTEARWGTRDPLQDAARQEARDYRAWWRQQVQAARSKWNF